MNNITDGADVVVDRSKSYPVPGYNGYEITPDGRVFSYKRRCAGDKSDRRELNGWVDAKGYRHVGFMIDGKVKSFSVHKVQELTFLGGTKPGLQIDHKDGNKQNNDITNLHQVTPLENSHNPVTHLRQLVSIRSKETRDKMSRSIRKKLEEDPEYKDRIMRGLRRCREIPEWCKERSKLQRELMQRPDMQRMIHENLRKMNEDPDMRRYNAERSKIVNSRQCKASGPNGEEILFESVTEAARYFGFNSGHVTQRMRVNKASREGWVFSRPDKEKKE